MSLFDRNIIHPLESLYDQCKQVVNWVVPAKLMHYNSEPHDISWISWEIRWELINSGLFDNEKLPMNDRIYRIGSVNVKRAKSVRSLPTYMVEFEYIKGVEDLGWCKRMDYEHLTTFHVGINGIINDMS